MLPFLYQTRTLRAFATPSVLGTVRHVHSPRGCRSRDNAPSRDSAIPFAWDDQGHDEAASAAGDLATMTKSEAVVFQGIFDEIARGRTPAAKRRAAPDPRASHGGGPGGAPGAGGGMARSIVEQARLAEFRDKFLSRYPASLRAAAEIALGRYTIPAEGPRRELALCEAAERRERARYDRARDDERRRVDARMAACATDAALWQVMEEEVFSLPVKLGVTDGQWGLSEKARERAAAREAVKDKKAKKKAEKERRAAERATKKAAKRGEAYEEPAESQPASDEPELVMDVHGPLYPHFLNTGLGLLDSAFARPSGLGFQVLPRVKAMGLASYVLGVSAPFYARLARMHWERHGDAGAALDVLREMRAANLAADDAVRALLADMRDHVHGCTWGAQGAFVMAMMEAPPYDGALAGRLERHERQALGGTGGVRC